MEKKDAGGSEKDGNYRRALNIHSKMPRDSDSCMTSLPEFLKNRLNPL